MTHFFKRILSGMAAVCMAVSAHAATDWPNRPIELVVGFAPGGNTDILARVLANHLSEELKNPVIVNNKPGATGLIGTNYVVGAKPDGYTYLVNVTGLVLSPHVSASVPLDLPMQLQAVAQVSSIPKAVVVREDFPANSFEELLRLAKERTLSYGSTGVGSGNHLTGELVSMTAGQPMIHATYRGSGPAMVDLLGGQIDMVFDDLPVVRPQIEEKRLKALMTLTKERVPYLPDVPSARELGYDHLIFEPWNGVLAPKGMDPEILAKMEKAIEKVVKSKAFGDELEAKGLKAEFRDSSDYAALIKEEYDRWGEVVRKAGIQRQ